MVPRVVFCLLPLYDCGAPLPPHPPLALVTPARCAIYTFSLYRALDFISPKKIKKETNKDKWFSSDSVSGSESSEIGFRTAMVEDACGRERQSSCVS